MLYVYNITGGVMPVHMYVYVVSVLMILYPGKALASPHRHVYEYNSWTSQALC